MTAHCSTVRVSNHSQASRGTVCGAVRSSGVRGRPTSPSSSAPSRGPRPPLIASASARSAGVSAPAAPTPPTPPGAGPPTTLEAASARATAKHLRRCAATPAPRGPTNPHPCWHRANQIESSCAWSTLRPHVEVRRWRARRLRPLGPTPTRGSAGAVPPPVLPPRGGIGGKRMPHPNAGQSVR